MNKKFTNWADADSEDSDLDNEDNEDSKNATSSCSEKFQISMILIKKLVSLAYLSRSSKKFLISCYENFQNYIMKLKNEDAEASLHFEECKYIKMINMTSTLLVGNLATSPISLEEKIKTFNFLKILMNTELYQDVLSTGSVNKDIFCEEIFSIIDYLSYLTNSFPFLCADTIILGLLIMGNNGIEYLTKFVNFFYETTKAKTVANALELKNCAKESIVLIKAITEELDNTALLLAESIKKKQEADTTQKTEARQHFEINKNFEARQHFETKQNFEAIEQPTKKDETNSFSTLESIKKEKNNFLNQTEEKKREIMGGFVFNAILALKQEHILELKDLVELEEQGNFNIAKVAGMLVDFSVFEVEDIIEMLENKDSLMERIKEARDLILNGNSE